MSKKKRKKQVVNQINYKEQAIDDCIEINLNKATAIPLALDGGLR